MPPFRSSKKELLLCAGFCCQNAYCAKPLACHANELTECCCCAHDCVCISCDSRFDGIPTKTCSCLPCCFVSPKCACCPKLKDLYQDADGDGQRDTKAEQKAIFGADKMDFLVCCGCCLVICGGSHYSVCPPRACCAHELTYCLCCASDCACPCRDSVPSWTCGYCGLMCCPKCACCPEMKTYYPDAKDWDDYAANVEDAAQAHAAAQHAAVQQPQYQPAQPPPPGQQYQPAQPPPPGQYMAPAPGAGNYQA